MTSFHDPNIKPAPIKTPSGHIPGNVLMIDDVALEGRCCYCSCQNQIVGLCWEHGGNVETEVTSFSIIETVHEALFDLKDPDKKVCFGTNATVVALAPYAQNDHYSPMPILASPSDKREKSEALASWINMVLSSYKTQIWGGNEW